MSHENDELTYFFHTRRFSSYSNNNPCNNTYPNYYKAKRFEIVLNEGDALYIPSGWFHHIYSETTTSNLNMSINFWTETTKKELDIFSNKYYHVTDIPKCESINKNIYETYTNQSQPFTFYNAFKNKTINELNSLFNDLLLYNCCQDDNTFISYLVDLNKDTKYNYITFSDFMNQNKGYNYVLGNNISEYLNKNEWIRSLIPEFLDDKIINTHTWLNHGNVSTRNHYDIYENVIVQIYGTKKIFLCPPDERDNLYMINPFSLNFIYKLKNMVINNTSYNNYILSDDSIINKSLPCVQYYKNNISKSICLEIINHMTNIKTHIGFIKHNTIDEQLYENLSKCLNIYFYSLQQLNIITDNFNITDTGYCVENLLYSNKKLIPENAKFKYIWFLNDSDSTYINNVKVSAIEGSLLIYPVHFSYQETEFNLTIDKWVCSGYIIY